MLDWLAELFLPILHGKPNAHPVIQSCMVLMLASAAGLAIGRVAIKGVSLGIAGVLFSGILFSHFGMTINNTVMEFAREFGLMLFVYTIGVQVGPGFMNSMRKAGLQLAGVVTGGILLDCVLVVCMVFALKVPIEAAIGVFCGALTNTPSLGAVTLTLRELGGEQVAKVPGLAYAVCYPFGILGVIMSFVAIRIFLGISIDKEKQRYAEEQGTATKLLSGMSIEITCDLDQKVLEDLLSDKITISRVKHDTEITLATVKLPALSFRGFPNTKTDVSALVAGDIIHAVGAPEDLEDFCSRIGKPAQEDIRSGASDLTTRDMIVTQTAIVGAKLSALKQVSHGNVVITRLNRMGVEVVPNANSELGFGDSMRVVGTPKALASLAAEIGDSHHSLDHTQLIPIFLGIATGVLLGNIAIPIPGLAAPLKLGLAGGVMVMAIVLSRINRIGPLLWYMPLQANLALREIGITLFLCCVGLKCGTDFINTLMNGEGILWMTMGFFTTLISMWIVGLFCIKKLKMNYLTTIGMIAGSHTNPPSLAYAQSLAHSDAASYGYAMYYPLAMLLRVVTAQILVLLLFSAS